MTTKGAFVTEGMAVLGVDHHQIGRVKRLRHAGIVVGRTLQPAVCVPREAVAQLRDNCVVLTLTADQVDDLWWAHAGEDIQVHLSGTYD